MEPLISVIIPTLNEEVLLPRLLECFKNQTVKEFEVIVADGGSKDKTIQHAKAYEAHLQLIINQSKGKNVASQRNIGAGRAKGGYLFFIDADSAVTPTCIEDIRREINKNPHGVYLGYVRPDGTSPVLHAGYMIANAFVRLSQLLPRPLCSVGSMIIDKELFYKIGKYEEDIYIGEDHNIVRKAKESGAKVHCIYNVKITFSLRRVKQEGVLRTLYILIVGYFHALVKGDIKKPIFTYEMGGQVYDKDSNSESIGK